MTRPQGRITPKRLDELGAELGICQGKRAWKVCPQAKSFPYGYISADAGRVLFFDSGIRT